MRQLSMILVCGAVAVGLSPATVFGDELTDTSFWTDFELASGYGPGPLAPDAVWPFTGSQPFAGTNTPRWEEKWMPGFNHVAVDVTTAQAHSGLQGLEFTGLTGGDPISQAAHIGMLDGAAGSPLTWIEQFSIYVPGNLQDPRVLRVEPFNNFPGQGFMYQFSLFQMASTNFRPELNNGGGVFNDLRDELGKAEGFEPDKWWNVAITADGVSHTITAVSISDDFGAVFSASGLSEPFGLGGADRPERLNYFGADGVFMDDISVVPEPAALGLILIGGVVFLRRR